MNRHHINIAEAAVKTLNLPRHAVRVADSPATQTLLSVVPDLIEGLDEQGEQLAAVTRHRDRLRIAWQHASHIRWTQRQWLRYDDERMAEVKAEHLQAREDEAYALNELHDARVERDDAQRAAAVLQSAANETTRRIGLALRTAADLHEFNSPEGEHLDGCPGCRLENELGEARPDPRMEALEGLAVRYDQAFAWLYADAKARATRKDTHQ